MRWLRQINIIFALTMEYGVFDIQTEQEFNDMALRVFKHQFENNSVYRSFCDLLYVHPSDIKRVEQIPFLPIQFFKSHEVISSSEKIQETLVEEAKK